MIYHRLDSIHRPAECLRLVLSLSPKIPESPQTQEAHHRHNSQPTHYLILNWVYSLRLKCLRLQSLMLYLVLLAKRLNLSLELLMHPRERILKN